MWTHRRSCSSHGQLPSAPFAGTESGERTQLPFCPWLANSRQTTPPERTTSCKPISSQHANGRHAGTFRSEPKSSWGPLSAHRSNLHSPRLGAVRLFLGRRHHDQSSELTALRVCELNSALFGVDSVARALMRRNQRNLGELACGINPRNGKPRVLGSSYIEHACGW